MNAWTRAIAPAAGVVLLTIVTIGLGLTVATAMPGELNGPTQPVVVSANAEGTAVELVHEVGDPIDVRELEVRVLVDGEPLDEQPPVPFFSARGFEAGPTGAFNVAAEQTWRPGEHVRFEIANTNDPVPEPGDPIVVELYVDGDRVGTAETVA